MNSEKYSPVLLGFVVYLFIKNIFDTIVNAKYPNNESVKTPADISYFRTKFFLACITIIWATIILFTLKLNSYVIIILYFFIISSSFYLFIKSQLLYFFIDKNKVDHKLIVYFSETDDRIRNGIFLIVYVCLVYKLFYEK